MALIIRCSIKAAPVPPLANPRLLVASSTALRWSASLYVACTAGDSAVLLAQSQGVAGGGPPSHAWTCALSCAAGHPARPAGRPQDAEYFEAKKSRGGRGGGRGGLGSGGGERRPQEPVNELDDDGTITDAQIAELAGETRTALAMILLRLRRRLFRRFATERLGRSRR